jgi:hypothetical protein
MPIRIHQGRVAPFPGRRIVPVDPHPEGFLWENERVIDEVLGQLTIAEVS